MHFVPLPKLPSTTETVDLLVLHVFQLHSIPLDIVSDLSPQFLSQVQKTFCQTLGATASFSSGYHLQTKEQTESANQNLRAASHCVTVGHSSSWSKQLPWPENTHNSLTSTATSMSLFMASLGYQPPGFSVQEEAVAVPSVLAHIQRCFVTA